MAEGVQASSWIEEGTIGCGEDHAGGADGGADIAGTHDAHAECSGGLIAGSGDHRSARAQSGERGSFRRYSAGDLVAFVEVWKDAGGHLDGSEHLAGPATMRDVEQQRARCVGDIHGLLASETKAYVVLRQQKGAEALPEGWFMAADPEQLGEGEVGERGIRGELDQALRAELRGERGGLSRGPLIAPDECGTQYTVRGVQQHGAMHLTAQADGCDFVG